MNLFKDLPNNLDEEVFEDLLTHKNLRIERIVSTGQTSPKSGWYDQEEHEWVLVLKGAGELTFESGVVKRLEARRSRYHSSSYQTQSELGYTERKKPFGWQCLLINTKRS